MNNAQTGEKIKRSFPIANKNISLDEFCAIMAGDNGLMAGKTTQIKGTINSIFGAIYEQLLLGNSVTLDNLVRFRPTIRGPVDADTGRPNAETILGVSILALKKMQLKMDNFNLVCSEGNIVEPKITAVYACVLNAVRDRIDRNKGFQLIGRNFYYDGAMGDTVVVSYTEEGLERILSITPASCTPGAMIFEFPEGMAAIADGTELTITLRTHMGVEDSAFSIASRKVVLAST